MTPILLTPFDISIAASLIILDAALSIWLKLRLHRQIALAAARMVVQLVAVGYVLRFIFTLNNPAATLLLVLVMVLVAGYELVQRQERRFRGWLAYGLGNATLLLVGGLATLYAVIVVVHPSPWYAPRYIVRETAVGAHAATV